MNESRDVRRMSALEQMLERLKRSVSTSQALQYSVPGLWCEPYDSAERVTLSNPALFYSNVIRQILYQPDDIKPAASWLQSASMYCVLPRHFTAYAHAPEIDADLHHDYNGWRQTGTFLKLIAALPYIRSCGCNTVIMLPFMQTGSVHKKGTLGSVYAIREPAQLDERLSEPHLDLDIDTQFQACVEAAHRLGMRVIVEFALRTTSRDSSWIAQHPDWYYWIRESEEDSQHFHPPHFDRAALDTIRTKVDAKEYHDLPIPSHEYQSSFVDTPAHVELLPSGQYRGRTLQGLPCVVPGAFADYPPDDTQPLWSDVSYLRMYDSPSFNYVAYNTIRMYDAALARTSTRVHSLWETLQGIIPSFVQRFAIDGAVLDMSHALPIELRRAIIDSTRALSPHFAFIEENFELSAESSAMGFDAVIGDLWLHAQNTGDFYPSVASRREHLTPIAFIASPDTHNTPRVAFRHSVELAKDMLKQCRTIPNGIPMILSGSEFGETRPINTGLGFAPHETAMFPAETLALFSAVGLNWDGADLELIRSLRQPT